MENKRIYIAHPPPLEKYNIIQHTDTHTQRKSTKHNVMLKRKLRRYKSKRVSVKSVRKKNWENNT